MKMNKWTMALAAAGVVSLSSVAQAQEAAAGANALAASTTLSGYVSTSYTTDDTGSSRDSTQLDVVDLKFASAQGAGEYATGYTVEFWAGPGASGLGTSAGSGGTSGAASTGTAHTHAVTQDSNQVELYQANIDLRLPIGNGLDVKVGQFTTNVGAETSNYNENAFYTRSHGYAVEPTHHTGLLASYQLSDDAGMSIGFVNDTTSNVTNTDDGGTAYLVTLNYTMPESTGVLGGTELVYARIDGAGADSGETDNQYLGATIPLPIEGVTYSVAWDIRENSGATADDNVTGHYLSYAANDKATINVRYEHGNRNSGVDYNGIDSVAIGLDYQLWENVISRVEYISDDWDGKTGGASESLVFNIVYSF